MKNKIYLLSGLPRSGSTLLCNILAQNPKIHVTPTNGLLQLLQLLRDNWVNIADFKAQGIENLTPRIKQSLKGIIEGYYSEELKDGSIIIDKDRGWLNNIEFIEEILDVEVKVITSVRDIKDISASFEKINSKNQLIPNNLYSNDATRLSIYSRTSDLLSDTGVIGRCINNLRDAYQKGYGNRIIMVPFNNLTREPENVLKELTKILELEEFQYKFTDMEQLINEDDTIYGLSGLHDIQKDVKYVESTADKVLGEQICKEINEKYSDYQKLFGGNDK